MTTVTLDSSAPRSLRALELAACSEDWTRLRTDNGEVAYGIPSQQVAGQVCAVTPTSCDCADARRGLQAPARRAFLRGPRRGAGAAPPMTTTVDTGKNITGLVEARNETGIRINGTWATRSKIQSGTQGRGQFPGVDESSAVKRSVPSMSWCWPTGGSGG